MHRNIIKWGHGRGDETKIRIEPDENLTEDEVVIRSSSLGEQVRKVKQAVSEIVNARQKFVFCRDGTEYCLPLDVIYFFETEGDVVYAHTRNDIFLVKLRLYELEERLPGMFMRVSKFTIPNVKVVYALTRTISSTCLVQLQGTHKQVYVSRYYYKPLRERLGGKG